MIFAVDGGGTTFKTCLVDEEGRLSDIASFPLKPELGIPPLRESLNAAFQQRWKESKERKRPIRAIGIGCRGIIDSANGVLVDDSGVMNFFNGHAFRELIDTDLPLGVENDAVAAAMGENKYGAGRRVRNFFLLTLGTGVGGGIVMDGKVVKRHTEMGHLPVNPNGDLCGCGNIGCIEREFSALAFETRIADLNNRSAETDRIRNVEDLFARARSGHRQALVILQRGIFFLARGISGYANALDPEKCILTGGIAKAGDFLINLLVEELKPILWLRDPAQFLEFSVLGDQMGLYGAGAVGAERIER